MKTRSYLAIDLKSFYASVECAERKLDPLTTNLVVADVSRTEKTICLAVSPSMKAYGIPGRARLFEVVQKVREVNAGRRSRALRRVFTGKSVSDTALRADPSLELDYIAAPPRMALYMEYSTRIYQIYLKYVSPDDIHVYSIDEVFIDVTDYLATYRMTPRELAMTMILEVLGETGITATAGIGTNLYLAKVAMDIEAKHIPPDRNGVRIAELDEMSYRNRLWTHRPLTDFWRVGQGYSRRLAEVGIYTMGDVARCSHQSEELLYRIFGVNAELLIDHAWGWEPTLISDIKAYRPETNSISTGQVLKCPYDFEHGRLIVREMTELLALDLVSRAQVTDQVDLLIGYETVSPRDTVPGKPYRGEYTEDRYGRKVPKPAHGSENLPRPTSSTRRLMDAVMRLYTRIVNPDLQVRRVALTANHLTDERNAKAAAAVEQLDFFTDYEAKRREEEAEEAALKQERSLQKATLAIQKKFGKNAILKGVNLEEGGTTVERNQQIGGHKA